MNRLLLLCCFFFTLTIATYAQTAAPSCAQTLRLAQSVYEQGRLHEVPGILQKCLNENGFNDQEKVNAYKILTNTYIYLEEPEEADKSMLELLRTDHYFEINEAVDPAEFVALYRTFRTKPIYRLGVKFGTNLTQPNTLNFNSIGEGNSSYDKKFGFSGGVSLEVPISPKITLNPELHFVIKSFKSKFDYIQNQQVYSSTTGGETQNVVSLPLLAQYVIFEKRRNPNAEPSIIIYATGGTTIDYLLASKISAEVKREGFQSIEVRSFSAKPQREKINLNATLGAGAKFRIAGGYFIAEARYNYGLSKINSSTTILNNQNLLFDYGYSDGIYRLNSLNITVGYLQNFFNPKKKSKN